MLEVVFYRSPLPHALIEGVDTGEALQVLGVEGAFTAEDMTDVSPFPDFDKNARPVAIFPLARGKVRYVGAPIAVVVAPDRYEAEDARDLLTVDLEPLDPVVSVDEALAPKAPPLIPGVAGQHRDRLSGCQPGSVSRVWGENDRFRS